MVVIKGANLALAFLLELALLAACAVALWTMTASWPTAGRVVVTVLVPLAVAVVWGLWLAPRSDSRFPMPWLVVAKVVLFALGVALLVLADRTGWGVALGALALVNIVLAVVWDQE